METRLSKEEQKGLKYFNPRRKSRSQPSRGASKENPVHGPIIKLGEEPMSRLYSILALVVLITGMSACSSQPADRSTASNGEEAQVYKPAVGEVRHFE